MFRATIQGVSKGLKLLDTGSDTAAALSDGFTFPVSASAGQSVILAFSSRTSAAVNNYSVSDSAGNTYTRIIEGTQSNGLTVSAIFVSEITSAITASSTTLTISTTGVSGEAAGVGFFVVGSTTTEEDSVQTPQTASTTLDESVVMSKAGLAIHVLGTGLISPPTGLTSTTGFTKLLENAQSRSSQWVFYKEIDGAETSTNTVPASIGNWSSAMAGFS